MADEYDLSEQLRERIRESGLSYAELSRRAEIRPATFSDFMLGKKTLTLETAAKIAAQIKVRFTLQMGRPLNPGDKE